MTKTQRAVYFAGICVAILAVGVLLLAFAAHAQASVLVQDSYTDYIWTMPTDTSGSYVASNGWSLLNDNQPISGAQAGTANGYALYTPAGAATWIAWELGGNGVGGFSIMECDVPFTITGGTSCPGTISFEYVNTVAASTDDQFVIATLTAPFTLVAGKYYAVSIPSGGGTSGGYANIQIYGSSAGTCRTNFAMSTGQIDCPGGFTHAWAQVFGTAFVPPTPPTPPDDTTSIVITNPTQGTTTPSTTFDIDIDYNIGTDLSSFSLDGSLPTRIGLQLTLFNTANQQQINLGTDYTIASTTGAHTYSTTTTQVASDYTLQARLVGVYSTNIPAPPDCTPYPPFQTCEGTTESTADIATSFAPTFSVMNGLFPILGFQIGSTTSRAGLATTTCSVVSIGGCFQNALAFLFFPSPGILDQFRFLWNLIQNKPPFGYVSQTITGLRSLNASSTPAFSFGSNLPLVGTIFTPFRTGLAGILWVGFFIAWYRGRLRHLDI